MANKQSCICKKGVIVVGEIALSNGIFYFQKEDSMPCYEKYG